MKTKTQNQNPGLKSRSEQVNTKQRSYGEHTANRELPTNIVLEFLRKQLPKQYELAEVVGKWIWLDFSPYRQRLAANALWRLGFHWNQRRCVWQHPCGACAPYEIHPKDPRSKYGSYFAADVLPA